MSEQRLAQRPTKGALTVPYMVDATLTPIDFKAVDSEHVKRCATGRRCGVCGGKIRQGPFAFVGPDDGRNCFADPWMHLLCAQTAMQQCPFLAGKRGWRENGDQPLIAGYERNMVLRIADDCRSHRDGFGHWHFEAVGTLRDS